MGHSARRALTDRISTITVDANLIVCSRYCKPVNRDF
jgi:hypothetical protein